MWGNFIFVDVIYTTTVPTVPSYNFQSIISTDRQFYYHCQVTKGNNNRIDLLQRPIEEEEPKKKSRRNKENEFFPFFER